MQFQVSYTRRVSYEAVVELDNDDIEQLLRDEVNASDATYEQGQLTLTVVADVDEAILEKVEQGLAMDETVAEDDGDIEDVDILGLA